MLIFLLSGRLDRGPGCRLSVRRREQDIDMFYGVIFSEPNLINPNFKRQRSDTGLYHQNITF